MRPRAKATVRAVSGMEECWFMLSSQDWWNKDEWTKEHYTLARQLMRTIHVLPRDFDEDVIQETALRYQKAKSTGKGGNYRAWLRTMLLRKSIDMLRKDRHIRSKNKPIFVSLEASESSRLTRRFYPILLSEDTYD